MQEKTILYVQGDMKMKRKIKVIIITGIVLLLLYNCMTVNIADLDIRDARVSLKSNTGEMATSLVPGETYTLHVTIEDMTGKMIDRPSASDLIFSSPDNTITTIEKSVFGIKADTTENSLVFTRLPGFLLTLEVVDNPYSQTYSWPVNWDEYDTLDYSGAPGSTGNDGRDGRDGSPTAGLADGGDGTDGWDGDHGKDGKDAVILVLYYTIDGIEIKGIADKTMLLLVDMTNKNEYLFKKQLITINASGGNGGDGGKGGDAGEGAEYMESEYDTFTKTTDVTREEGEDGKPGAGGSGGNGGDGGDITLSYVQEDILDYIIVTNIGGRGGEEGEDGDTPDFSAGSRGIKFDGNHGEDGEVIYKKLSAKQARTICSLIENPPQTKENADPGDDEDGYFELERVILE
jgi:hypothetical protein